MFEGIYRIIIINANTMFWKNHTSLLNVKFQVSEPFVANCFAKANDCCHADANFTCQMMNGSGSEFILVSQQIVGHQKLLLTHFIMIYANSFHVLSAHLKRKRGAFLGYSSHVHLQFLAIKYLSVSMFDVILKIHL